MAKKRKAIVREVDMSKADGYAVPEGRIIRRAIRKDGLGRQRLLYSGLEGEELKTLLKHGTLYPDSDYIFASEHLDQKDFDTLFDATALFYAWTREIPMLAVYDRDKFEGFHYTEACHRFLNPNNKLETLLAVYLLLR